MPTPTTGGVIPGGNMARQMTFASNLPSRIQVRRSMRVGLRVSDGAQGV